VSLGNLKLTAADVRNPLWLTLSEALREELASLRQQNDAEKPPEQTAHLRGRIAAVKQILALGDQRLPLDE